MKGPARVTKRPRRQVAAARLRARIDSRRRFRAPAAGPKNLGHQPRRSSFSGGCCSGAGADADEWTCFRDRVERGGGEDEVGKGEGVGDGRSSWIRFLLKLVLLAKDVKKLCVGYI